MRTRSATPTGRIHVVVNGIVENYVGLRDRLIAAGATFSSQTDAEVIAQLIASEYDGDLAATVQQALGQLDGFFAFVAMALDEPDVLVGARRECPLVIGRGADESFVASAVPAFLAHTRYDAADRERRDRRAARRRGRDPRRERRARGA